MKYEDIKVGDKFVCSSSGFSSTRFVVTVTKALPQGGFRMSNGRMFRDRIPHWLEPMTPELQAKIDLASKRQEANLALYRLDRECRSLPETVLDKILEAYAGWEKVKQVGQVYGGRE